MDASPAHGGMCRGRKVEEGRKSAFFRTLPSSDRSLHLPRLSDTQKPAESAQDVKGVWCIAVTTAGRAGEDTRR